MGLKEIPLTLYDLEHDIEETINVAAQYPEIVEKLSKLAKDFDTDLKKNMRPAGQVEL